MAVPKQRHTKSRRNKRRMHLYIEESILGVCPKCGKPVKHHTVCLNCGYYKGAEAVDVLKKLNRKERKKREKEIHAKEGAKEGPQKEGALGWEELSRK